MNGRVCSITAEQQPNSIVEGDFNCVENTSLDTKYKAGSQTTYAKIHGKEQAKHMADIGLLDIYRMLNPKMRAGFTQIGRSVMNRIDKWYGQYDASPWQWRNVDSSIGLFRTRINQSDHYAITATVETIGDRPPHMGDTRINPEVYTSEKIRKAVETLWVNSVNKRPTPTYSREETWEYTKTIVSIYLKQQSIIMRSTTETTPISKIKTALNDLKINMERLAPSTLLKARESILLERLVYAKARVKRSKQKAYEATM
eukprot:6173307-Pleurochrysis_carterae.AAC.1